MIYYEKNGILIRDLQESDAQILTDEEIAQGWHQSVEKYLMRLQHQAEGRCVSFVAEYQGSVAGYVNLYPFPKEGPFKEFGYPEIVDLGVLEKFRNHGIGTALLDVAEAFAARSSDTVSLSVGLHSGYGNAHRLYVKRGYLPDGSGAWYGKQPCPPYSACRNDDDLVLYLSKKLR